MCPTVSENPQSGYFGGGSGNAQKMFPNKLMVTASLLYAIWLAESFIGTFSFWIVGDTCQVLGGNDYKEE